MTTRQFLISGWSWNPLLLAAITAALAGYRMAFGGRGRGEYWVGSLGVIALALISPLHALAGGYLFSAHMVQHILLLLIAPALALLSLPASFSIARPLRSLTHPVVGWLSGVGAMWLWHAPALCNAAAVSSAAFALQTVSLLALGGLFWWQILAPRSEQRLPPLAGIVYLFTACLACSVLGIIITLSPVRLCPIFMHTIDRLGLMSMIRDSWGLTPEKDQQIGGLLMWAPMCFIYLTAILGELARWYTAPASGAPEKTR